MICPNFCREYCPQEVFIKNYPGDQSELLSLVDFKRIISGVPKSVIIDFSGFCEPFVNKETIEMVKFANNWGYRLSMFTTLRGASESDVHELIKIPFFQLCLHLPDGKFLSFPLTQEYMLNVFTVIKGVRNAVFMSMNDSFKSDNRENVVRGLYRKSHHFRYCWRWAKPDFVVLPNGDVHLCSRDFGLWHKVGNLLHENYSEIRERYLHSRNFELCRYCTECLPYQVIVLREIGLWVRDHLLSPSPRKEVSR